MPLILFAEGAGATGNEALKTVMTESFTKIGTDIQGMISDLLPIALGIFSAIMVITFGIKIFKKLTGKA